MKTPQVEIKHQSLSLTFTFLMNLLAGLNITLATQQKERLLPLFISISIIALANIGITQNRATQLSSPFHNLHYIGIPPRKLARRIWIPQSITGFTGFALAQIIQLTQSATMPLKATPDFPLNPLIYLGIPILIYAVITPLQANLKTCRILATKNL